MTLERVVSVTTFTNDHQVTTTTSGRQRPASLSYVDEERGYSTLPRNSPSKSPELSYTEFARLANTVSQDPICRTSSQRSFLRTASARAIPSPSTDDLRHRDPRDFPPSDHHRHQHHHRNHHQQRSHHHTPHHPHHRPISHAVSSPACNSNPSNHHPSSGNRTQTTDTRDHTNHISDEPPNSNSRRRRHHDHHSSNNDHLSSSDGPRSRYRKHETSASKPLAASCSGSNTKTHQHHHRHHPHSSREYVQDFTKVKKAHSESALYVDSRNHLHEEEDPNPDHRHYARDRPVRRNHSAHQSSSRTDNPPTTPTHNPPTTPTHTVTTATTTQAVANSSDNDNNSRRRRYHRRYSSSPESPKQPKACALSYVFPWSQRNKNNRRRQRSPSRYHHQSPPSSSSPSRDRCRRNLDQDLESESINHRQTTPLDSRQRLSTTRPLSIIPPPPSTNHKDHALLSPRLSPDSDYPQTPKSAPVRSRPNDPTPNPFELTEDCPISPKSAPAFAFDITPDNADDGEIEEESGGEEEEENNHHRYNRHRYYQPHQRSSSHHQSSTNACRSRSENRYKSSAVRDKSEDAFYRQSDSDDLNNSATHNKSLGDSRKSLRDSNGRLYTSNNTNHTRSRSNHSSSHHNHVRDRERELDNHRTVSSSGTTSDPARSRQSHSRSKSRPSRTGDQGTEEGSHSQCQNTEESSTDCSARKIQRASLKPVDLDPRIDSFGCYVSEVDKRVINDEEDFQYRPTDMKGPIHLSFCGCGFLGMYHLGVVSSLTQRGPGFLDKVQKFAGASAGALMAALLVTAPEKVEESVTNFHHLSKAIRSKPLGALTPGYSLAKSLRSMLEDVLPEDAHLDASGRLYVSLTNGSSKKNEIWSQFESREELIQVLIASCFIPIYAGARLPIVRGKRYMDGGLTNNLVQFNTGRTVTVSPFDGKSDVGPKAGQEASNKKAHFVNFHNQNIQMNMQNLRRGAHAFFPPRKTVLQEYFDKGRLDASRFLIREGLYEVDVPQQTQSVIYESSV